MNILWNNVTLFGMKNETKQRIVAEFESFCIYSLYAIKYFFQKINVTNMANEIQTLNYYKIKYIFEKC